MLLIFMLKKYVSSFEMLECSQVVKAKEDSWYQEASAIFACRCDKKVTDSSCYEMCELQIPSFFSLPFQCVIFQGKWI